MGRAEHVGRADSSRTFGLGRTCGQSRTCGQIRGDFGVKRNATHFLPLPLPSLPSLPVSSRAVHWCPSQLVYLSFKPNKFRRLLIRREPPHPQQDHSRLEEPIGGRHRHSRRHLHVNVVTAIFLKKTLSRSAVIKFRWDHTMLPPSAPHHVAINECTVPDRIKVTERVNDWLPFR